MKVLKLNQLLAKTEAELSVLKTQLKEYFSYFRNSQGDFKGSLKTYEPAVNYADVPKNRESTNVVTTVDEKINYLFKILAPAFSGQLDIEATNASGMAKADLVINGVKWGTFSSLELMRLKNIVTDPKLTDMIKNIPVRSDKREWVPTEVDQYKDRNIVQTPDKSYSEFTTEKTQYILSDPNVSTSDSKINYVPQVATKTTKVEVGSGTFTEFSGEWTHRQRANTLKKLSDVVVAVTEALARANSTEVVSSDLSGTQLFNYIFNEQ